MTPGSLVLGNAGQSFECGHEHGAGDRCISFWYAPDYFERLAFESGDRTPRKGFKALRLPPMRETSGLIARACSGLAGPLPVPWEELSIKLAALALQVSSGLSTSGTAAPPASVSRVTRIVREIERQPDAGLALGHLAHEAGLSPYHFLRTFQTLTGLTPHRYVLRARLRQVAVRLAIEAERVIDIALDSVLGMFR